MNNIFSAPGNSKMNALKTGFFAQTSLEEVEDDPYFQEQLHQLLPLINQKSAEQLLTAKEISFWHFKEKQLDEAMDYYQKKWHYRQYKAKDFVQKATRGRAPILKRPDLSILFMIQKETAEKRAEMAKEHRQHAKIIQDRMHKMRTNYAIIMDDHFFNQSEGMDIERYAVEDIKLCHKAISQALKFMEIDYAYHQNQWVYCEYAEEIMAYLEAIPKTPDTGHWRNMLSEKNKIQQILQELNQKLTLLQDDSEEIMPNNSFSEKPISQEVSKEIHKALGVTNQKMTQFKDKTHTEKKKKRMR